MTLSNLNFRLYILLLNFSIKNIHGDTAPRSGFFHIFKRKEFLIRKWNISTEDISAEGNYIRKSLNFF